MRDVLAHVPKTAKRWPPPSPEIWAQPDAATTHAQLGRIAEQHDE